MAQADARTRHSPPCCNVWCLRQSSLKQPSRYSPYSIRSAMSAEECSDQYFSDLSLNEQPAIVPQPNSPHQHSLAPQCQSQALSLNESHSAAAQSQQVFVQQLQQYVTASGGQQYQLAQLHQYYGETQQDQQNGGELLTLQQGDWSPEIQPKQDVLVNVAISLCARALNKAVKAFQTAHRVCLIAPDSAAADRTLELAEALMDTTIRRLRLAQNLAAVRYPECAIEAGTALPETAAATWGPGPAAGPDALPAGSQGVSASPRTTYMSGSSLQQQQHEMSPQEEVCSSWEC